MDDTTEGALTFFAVQGALVAALIHLWEGLPNLLVYLPRGSFVDPRPYLFVPSALLLLGILAALYLGKGSDALYALGAGILLGYLAGYVWWHLGDHGGFVPGGHTNASPVAVLAQHLLNDPVEFISKVAELVGAAAFLGLLVGDTSESTADREERGTTAE
ncbi:hypothetical protein [Halegenticoccus tardaugens]|uniref:hypothetical protein n=1 Tax=Halegenticoccus tardaugens TaxID=2071624 RepID=UPI00100A727D|nr:hypothetical protein [Halegenticoccus tardaugens]